MPTESSPSSPTETAVGERRWQIACVLVLLVIGLGLRASSYRWNERPQGDVNLFALTARELVHSGRLFYPMKYEFSDRVAYCAPRSPASQHPPLFPFLAGSIGLLLATDDTFWLLKILSELGGAALLLFLAERAVRTPRMGAPGMWSGSMALALVVASPTLVDFSGNGSPYVWSSFFLLLTGRLLSRRRFSTVGSFAIGLLGGLAPQLHSTLVVVPASALAFFAVGWRRVPPKSWLAFGGGLVLALAPWVAWSLRHFGVPMYSYAPHIVWTSLGAAQEGVYDDVVTWRFVGASWAVVAGRALGNALRSAAGMAGGLLADGGPAAVLLALAGLATAMRRSLRDVFGWALAPALYVLLVLPLDFRGRFVVPLLPLFYVAAGYGFSEIWRAGYRGPAALCVVATVAWMVPAYGELVDSRRWQWHEAMLPVAQHLAVLPPGTVLAYGVALDGGIEGVYHHRHHTVRGQSHGPAREAHKGELLRKLARDFHARYLWCDRFTRKDVERVFPDARILFGNGSYYVLELPAGAGGVAGACGRLSAPGG